MSIGLPARESKTDHPLKVIFMGTPMLAAHILERLVATAGRTHIVVAAVTQPDRPKGRGMRRDPSEVGATAVRLGLPVLKPEKIRTAEFLAELNAFSPDLIVVAAYGRILPATILAVPRLMPINVHMSLLPRYRGASPIEAAILAGDDRTGVTIIRVTERLDAGPILLQRTISLEPTDTQGILKAKLAEIGAEAAIEAIEKIANGTIVETPQDESLATYTTPVTRDDAVIDWSADAVMIERMTRAYDPWPIARTTFRTEPLLIFRARVDAGAGNEFTPGTVVALNPEPVIQCGIGRLVLVEVQAAGRKRMRSTDFARGRRIAVGERLGS
jgi:methionyl-tRNA formyltransferase